MYIVFVVVVFVVREYEMQCNTVGFIVETCIKRVVANWEVGFQVFQFRFECMSRKVFVETLLKF